MSDLQLSLIVIGVTIIGGVWLFNLAQEHNLRKRLDRAFGDAPKDVLLPGDAPADAALGRVEPQLQPAQSHGAPSRHAAGPAAAPPVAAPPVDPELDCTAEVEAGDANAGKALDALLAALAECGRPTRAFGFDAASGGWEELQRGVASRHRRFRLALQLVNRSGAANAAQLAIFCDAARAFASGTGGRAVVPDASAAAKNAQELDGFCSGVDVAIVVNVVSPPEGGFSGARIRELAEAAGFRLEPDGVFHCRDEHRRTLFTLDNEQPGAFAPEKIRTLTTRAITLMLDVPRVSDGAGALDRMLDAGRELAAGLGGRLVDDNQSVLSEAGIARIREQLHSISEALAARGMPAGGERALRLFS